MSVIFTKTCNNVYAFNGQTIPPELKLDTWDFYTGNPDSVGIISHPSFSKTVHGWETIKNGMFLLNVELGLTFDVVVCQEEGVEEPTMDLENIQWNNLDQENTEITWSIIEGHLEGVAFFSFNEDQIDENHPVMLKLYYTRLAYLHCTSG